MPSWLLELFFKETGFDVIKFKYVGAKPGMEVRNVKSIVNGMIAAFLSVFMKKEKEGELSKNCVMFLLKKKRKDSERR